MRVNLDTTRSSKNLYRNNFNQQKLSQSQTRMTMPFAQDNGAYGKAIAFGTGRTIRVDDFEVLKKGLVDFIEAEVKPFLAQTKEFSDKNHELHRQADAMTSNYFQKVIMKDDDFDILNKKGFEGYAKVGKYLKNIDEYNYLKGRNNDSSFGTEEAREYASEIAPLFEPVPFLEHYRGVVISLKKVEKSIKNGFEGLKPIKKDNGIKSKRDEIKEAESLTLFNQHFISSVSIFSRNTQKALETSWESDPYHATKILKYSEQIPEIRESIKKHNELLPELNQRTQEAEQLINEHSFTAEDVQKAVDAHNLKKQGIIARNLKKFFESLESQPQYKWDDSLNAQADELLQKQSDANKKLWEMIEKSKKEYFSPEAVAQRKAQEAAEYQKWMRDNNYTPDDIKNLPF